MEADKVHEIIGELLAEGHLDDDIISTLEESEGLTNEEACAALHSVYDSWQHTRSVLDLNDDNLKDWHVFLRKHILQNALGTGTVPSLRLALSVLDSLAAIQGISTTQGQSMPLTITLVEKKEGTSNDGNDENAV